MTDADKLDFAKMMEVMCLAYNRESSQELMRLYFADLKRFSIEQIAYACEKYRRSPAEFFPRVGKLIELIEGNSDTKAIDAWIGVIELIGQHDAESDPESPKYFDSRHAPKFDDARTKRALTSIGGWTVLCQTPVKDHQWLQKRFIEAYTVTQQVDEQKQIGRDEASKLVEYLGYQK